MKILFTASIAIVGIITAAVAQQPGLAPGSAGTRTTIGQSTLGGPQSSAVGSAADRVGETAAGPPPVGAAGPPPVNATGRSPFDPLVASTVPQNVNRNLPLFLNVFPAPVTEVNGRLIGAMQQVVLSRSGSIDFALLAVNGRLVPVPWDLLIPSGTPGNPSFSVPVDGQLLAQAPSLGFGELPLLADNTIRQGIFSYFGLTGGATATAQGSTGNSSVVITGGDAGPPPMPPVTNR